MFLNIQLYNYQTGNTFLEQTKEKKNEFCCHSNRCMTQMIASRFL